MCLFFFYTGDPLLSSPPFPVFHIMSSFFFFSVEREKNGSWDLGMDRMGEPAYVYGFWDGVGRGAVGEDRNRGERELGFLSLRKHRLCLCLSVPLMRHAWAVPFIPL